MSAVLATLLLSITGACPRGWYVNGVQRSGVFECRPVLGRPDDDIADARAQRVLADDRVMHGIVLCATGSVPIHDGHRVSCLTSRITSATTK